MALTLNKLYHQELNDNFDAIAARFAMFQKAMSGDMVFKLSQATASPTAAAVAADDVVYNLTVRLEDAAGNLHDWYNGEVLLAISDDDSTGNATISPAGGEHKMTNGVLAFTVTLPKAVWTAGKVVTATVSDPATASTGILGCAVPDVTFVATIAAA